MSASLSLADKKFLLQLARASIAAAVAGQPPPAIDPAQLSPALTRLGASFITLTERGELRGCIGGLMPQYPLYEDVQIHAAQSALEDYRFPPVVPAEVPRLEVEVSVLTEPQPLEYDAPQDLPRRLRPEVDGVILGRGQRRATFLPQVWERIPDAETFLSMLCDKMGVAPDTWRRTKLDVQIYQVEKFTEGEMQMHKA